MTDAREQVVLAAYVIGWRVVRALPEPLARAVFAALADVAWWRRGDGVRRLETNLRRVVGPAVPQAELRALTRAGMRSYLRYWCEAFQLPSWPTDRVERRVRAVGEVPAYRRAVADGTGFVVALPHMGNWDLAGAWSCLQGGAVVTVAERLRPAALFERFVAYREQLGMEVLPLGASRELFDTLAERARAGAVVCLLADRDLSATGVEVDFFGAPARMPPGPALLALRTGAPLHPVTVTYDAQGVVLRFHPRVEVPPGRTREQVAAMTQAVARAFETAIREAPQDWHMLQRIWAA